MIDRLVDLVDLFGSVLVVVGIFWLAFMLAWSVLDNREQRRKAEAELTRLREMHKP